jgi:phage shock protein A
MQSNLSVAASTERPVILSAFEARRRISADLQSNTPPSPPVCGANPQQATVRLKQRSFFMGLLERVSTLIRANINDVIDRAEDPEKMIKQVILDMENQYMQVKTQVAVSIADQHMLEKKQKENEDVGADWMRKAERAVDKQQDDLARAALDRYQTSQRLALSYREQVDDQKVQVEALKGALMKLEQKLDEAKSKRDMLIARHRRSVALNKAAQAHNAAGDGAKSAAFDRLKDRVNQSESVASAELELNSDEVGERLNRLDRDTEVERLLTDLKQRRLLPG